MTCWFRGFCTARRRNKSECPCPLNCTALDPELMYGISSGVSGQNHGAPELREMLQHAGNAALNRHPWLSMCSSCIQERPCFPQRRSFSTGRTTGFHRAERSRSCSADFVLKGYAGCTGINQQLGYGVDGYVGKARGRMRGIIFRRQMQDLCALFNRKDVHLNPSGI